MLKDFEAKEELLERSSPGGGTNKRHLDLLQRQLSSFDTSRILAKSRMIPNVDPAAGSNDYVLCWQQHQQNLNEELSEEVRIEQTACSEEVCACDRVFQEVLLHLHEYFTR